MAGGKEEKTIDRAVFANDSALGWISSHFLKKTVGEGCVVPTNEHPFFVGGRSIWCLLLVRAHSSERWRFINFSLFWLLSVLVAIVVNFARGIGDGSIGNRCCKTKIKAKKWSR